MSILQKLKNVTKSTTTEVRTSMTKLQIEQCKAAIRSKNRGFNVQPNIFDISKPYRVAINFKNKWYNYGNFKSADVAAAIGTIVSVAFFGEKAVAGTFDEELVEKSEEFKVWIADARNADVLSKANGDSPTVLAGGELVEHSTEVNEEDNPF